MDDRESGVHLVSPAARRGPSILVVESSADHLELVSLILEDAGYHVEGVSDARAALERLVLVPPPDLVLMDLILPGMDGWQLVAALEARPALAAIPIVVLTGAGPLARLAPPPSAAFLDKPVVPELLCWTIAACLSRRGPSPPRDGVSGA